ncbi:comK regulator [Alkalihalophilus pseudofirmus OF4]|uniref:ComK regulator n=1 Tax=Alkalihalophilus pseudofirmus (strain ATCC BAA-2126 / JCM 17055 / OF4) TaxID=398511 RepID=D3FU33_ALKPO|nr:YlbF family regulator [Alkalihalophilus pseudofirmus]ADC48235.1 comK regulator [Alkalihalophilus pseudofirmus OF4]
MLLTMSTIELMDQSEELAKSIGQSDVFIQYIHAKKALENDQPAQKLIVEFTEMKERHEEVQRFGRYHPDYDTVSTEIRQLKRKVDVTESVKEFKAAERELEMLLNEVSELIAHSISKTIKVPTGNPYFDQMSCSGGCGSGGGCSCG